MRENADQNNSEYGHFLRSELFNISQKQNIRNSDRLKKSINLICFKFQIIIESLTYEANDKDWQNDIAQARIHNPVKDLRWSFLRK